MVQPVACDRWLLVIGDQLLAAGGLCCPDMLA
jgi:hypothetical protein